MNESPHILMTGGGTLGPVTPLLAVADLWRQQDPEVRVSWVGTSRGPERALIEASQIPFLSIPAPKLDRHRRWKWLGIPIMMLVSCFMAWKLLREHRPDMVFTAGGYVSVPVVFVAWAMRIPCWVHQLDAEPGLANRLMAPFARRISVTWDSSLEHFPEQKTRVVGGVVRVRMLHGDADRARDLYDLNPEKLTVLVTAGGTGAVSVNEAMAAIGPDLLDRANIVHLTGKGKMLDELQNVGPGYAALEFLGEGMADAYAVADVVVSRAGMASLIELAALKKPVIFLPLPNADQISNAKVVEEQDAARVMWDVNPQILKQEIDRLLDNQDQRKRYARRMGMLLMMQGAEQIVREAQEFLRE